MNNTRKIICIIVSFICFHMIVIGQTNPLQKKTSISVQRVSIEKTLHILEKNAQIHFSYNPEIVPIDSIISITVQNLEVQKILKQVFGQRFVYKTSGNYIIITKNKQTSSNTITVKGTVSNKSSGDKIANTSVFTINGKEQVLTDTSGKFYITINPKTDDISLEISNENFEDTLVFINTDSLIDLQINLEPKQVVKSDSTLIESNQIVSKLVDSEMKTHSKNIDYINTRSFQVSLLPFLGSNHIVSGSIANNVSFNIFAGYSHSVKGLEFGGFCNITRRDVTGIQFGGFGNFVGNNTLGIQSAGFFNQNLGNVIGIQCSGFYNSVSDTLKGIQSTGFANLVFGTTTGIQTAGFINYTRKRFIGCQVAGFANIITDSAKLLQVAGFTNAVFGNSKGIQISGFSNLSTKGIDGGQISGLANFSFKETNGFQIAGLMNTAFDINGTQLSSLLNIAHNVTGVQFGLINIADSVSGTSIGFLSLIRKGFHQISIEYSNAGDIQLHINLGTTQFYNIVGLAIFPKVSTNITGATYGIGSLLFAKKLISVSPNFTSTSLILNTSNAIETGAYLQAKIDCNIRIGEHLHVFVAPQYSSLLYLSSNTDFSEISQTISASNITTKTFFNFVGKSWIGVSGGIKITI